MVAVLSGQPKRGSALPEELLGMPTLPSMAPLAALRPGKDGYFESLKRKRGGLGRGKRIGKRIGKKIGKIGAKIGAKIGSMSKKIGRIGAAAAAGSSAASTSSSSSSAISLKPSEAATCRGVVPSAERQFGPSECSSASNRTTSCARKASMSNAASFVLKSSAARLAAFRDPPACPAAFDASAATPCSARTYLRTACLLRPCP